jgi:N-glycosylase/DNA lyase
MTEKINVSDFALAPTLECGQVFRWQRAADCWFVGVIGNRVARLRQRPGTVEYELFACSRSVSCGQAEADASATGFIRHYLALDVSLPQIIGTFPEDAVLQDAVRRHWGLRVVRQEPWECLASFIASSTKQIVQIRQIVSNLARNFGAPIETPFGIFHSFPSVEAIARASHEQLWNCKLGFRAKNLLAAARMIDRGGIDWARICVGAASPPRSTGPVAAGTPLLQPRYDYESAMAELMKLPGVGEKVASCVLLFSCGFDQAFPIDVWIERALRRIYFAAERNVSPKRLREFTRSHFGPYAGWAQQYLFFNERTRSRGELSTSA